MAAVKRMESGEEAAPDDTLVEVWKCLRDKSVDFLTNLFNTVLRRLRRVARLRREVTIT